MSAHPRLAFPAAAIADDLRLLAALHAREPDAATIDGLRSAGFPDCLSPPDTPAAREAGRLMGRALAALGDPPAAAQLDELAADFAAIYLNNACGASPCESVWLDEDHVTCQAPMFEVREWYRRFGAAAPDWRRQPDDHLVLQLQFVARLIELGEAPEAARFLDLHLLRWLPQFAQRVAQRCATPYFAALAAITLERVRALRARLQPA